MRGVGRVQTLVVGVEVHRRRRHGLQTAKGTVGRVLDGEVGVGELRRLFRIGVSGRAGAGVDAVLRAVVTGHALAVTTQGRRRITIQ